MDFDFLPKLPKSNLDDRTFKDLVEECILRIPRYCPEWTNHNPSDPGITLIELFAWLTDQMLMRFNQVPRRNYVVFLELLGIRLQPPTPAQTELTFYLTKAQPFLIKIPDGTEVATVRTETEEAVVFTTDRELVIGNPRLIGFLTAEIDESIPQALSEQPFGHTLRDRTPPPNGQWSNLEETPLFEQCTPHNCFYLVLEPSQLSEDPEDADNSIEGNVLAITFKGEAATVTGIDPNNPPLRWEAWNGREWQPTILRQKADDRTKGFSFDQMGQQGPNPLVEGADVILHLPQQWPSQDFGTNYRGHWIRCVYTSPDELQPPYGSSPRIVGLDVRAIGGAVNATECIRIHNELLGVSDGKAGQTFELERAPVLERKRELQEYIQVNLPGGESEIWEEVRDFADSDGEDTNGEQPKHYTIDPLTGTVQFGPLIREPSQLKRLTQERTQLQPRERFVRRENGRVDNRFTALPPGDADDEILERQYGKVPPPGAEIYMVAYRTGGGSRGNVQAEKLTVLKTAIPYVKNVVNYKAAEGGTDAESLEQAVIRVPKELRTRECAVMPEDFENVAKKAHRAVARAHCLSDSTNSTPGIVRLLIVPRKVDIGTFDFHCGMHPDQYFSLGSLEEEIQEYMKDRKPLGVQVKLQEPEYVGVSVKAEVILEPNYTRDRDKEEIKEKIRSELLVALYRFLNPLTGGIDRKGWPLGRPVYRSDIFALCQNLKIPGVRYYLGMVKLFELRKYGSEWVRTEFPESDTAVDPSSLGLICSWADESPELESGHVIEFIDY